MLETLTLDQLVAATEEWHTLIAAGPGSGKTRVMVAKASHLLTKYDTARVCAVTFTRESAAELRMRTLAACNESDKNRLAFGTFHSLAMKQLQRVGPLPPLVGHGQRLNLVVRAMRASGLDALELEEAFRLIEGSKAGFLGHAGEREMGDELARAYATLLERNHMIDFQDIILRANEGMRTGELKPIAAHFMLVDEFQDTDKVQYEWLMAHVRNGTRATVVADDDQCVYSWRGALGYPGMEQYANELQARRFTIATNYRSHSEIVTLASHVIAGNTRRIDKQLRASRGDGGHVQFRIFPTPVEEAEALCEAARERPEGWAVLARTNYDLHVIESALLISGIPYQREGGSLWDEPHVSHLMCLLRCVGSRKHQHAGLDAILSWAGIGEDDLGLLRSACGTNLAEPAGKAPQISNRTIYEGLVQAISAARKLPEPEQVVSRLVEWLLQRMSALRRGSPSPKAVVAVNAAARVVQRLNGSLAQRLAYLQRAERDRQVAGVKVQTMHGSKGLEFDNVWMVQCSGKSIPGEAPNEPEERRLFYVAMTRAKNFLSVSCVGSPSPYMLDALQQHAPAFIRSGEAFFPSLRAA